MVFYGFNNCVPNQTKPNPKIKFDLQIVRIAEFYVIIKVLWHKFHYMGIIY